MDLYERERFCFFFSMNLTETRGISLHWGMLSGKKWVCQRREVTDTDFVLHRTVSMRNSMKTEFSNRNMLSAIFLFLFVNKRINSIRRHRMYLTLYCKCASQLFRNEITDLMSHSIAFILVRSNAIKCFVDFWFVNSKLHKMLTVSTTKIGFFLLFLD